MADPASEPTSEHSSPPPHAEEPAQHDPINLEPPLPPPPPDRITTKSLQLQFGSYLWSTEENVVFCARNRRKTIIQGRMNDQVPVKIGVEAPSLEAGRSHALEKHVDSTYIVVGIMGNDESISHETLLRIPQREDLFKQIRKAERELRSPFRRLLSLKSVNGFGLYQCHPSQDYHSYPEVSDKTRRWLAEFYRNYRTGKIDYQDRWMDWIHKNFNGDSIIPGDGKFALQLLLRWSALKLIIWSSIPIILSMAIGLWYMMNPYTNEDYVAIVQTAWTIASYIVTTAAFALAAIASITRFGDI